MENRLQRIGVLHKRNLLFNTGLSGKPDLPVREIIKWVGEGGGQTLDHTGDGENGAALKADGREGHLRLKRRIQLGGCGVMGRPLGRALGCQKSGEVGACEPSSVYQRRLEKPFCFA